MQVHRNQDGELVGYFSAHVFRRTVSGRDSIILRGEAGMLGDYRGSASNLRFGFTQAMRIAMAYPGKPVYFLGSLIHPSAYYNLSKYIRPIWPSPDVPPEGQVLATLSTLGDSFGLERIRHDPLIRDVGWRTLESDVEAAYWAQRANPAVRFFIAQNPTYREGHGMLTMVPINAASLGVVTMKMAEIRGRRSLTAIRRAATTLPLAGAALARAERMRTLGELPALQGLPAATVQRLADQCEIHHLPPRWELRTPDDTPPMVHFIARGAVLLCGGDAAESIPLVQLDAGALFDAHTVFNGAGPRAQTATRCTLVAIPTRFVGEAASRCPTLAAHIQDAFTAVQLASLAVTSAQAQATSAQDRAHALKAATHHTADAGTTISPARTGWMLTLTGDARFSEDTDRVVSAPTLRRLSPQDEVVAHTELRWALLPPDAFPPADQPPAPVSPRADEVSAPDFEALVAGLGLTDGRPCLCGPETVTWRVYSETAALLGGPRALLLQFAHPLCQGLIEHGDFVAHAGERVHRTMEYMYGMAFGRPEDTLRMAREVFSKHQAVQGIFRQSRGPFRAGDRYAANQIELLLWVAATLTDTSVRVHEALIGPLSDADRDALVAEAGWMYGLFGIPRDRFPPNWAAFRAYFDGVIDSGVLEADANALALSRAVLTAPNPNGEALFLVLRRLTRRWLPEPLCAPFGLQDGPVARAAGDACERALKLAIPHLPPSIRLCPARQQADARIHGHAPPPTGAASLDRLIAAALGASDS